MRYTASMGLRQLTQIHPKRQLREFYWFSALFSFAYALMSIFEPVFLYQQHFPLWQIAMYYALHYSLYIWLLPLGARLAAWFGLERSLSLAMPIFMVYLLTLASLPWQHSLYWVAVVLLTCHKIFYWPAFHAEFIRFGDGHNRGTELSWIFLISLGLGILGPILGGIIIHFYGFPALFVVTALFLLGACVPLLRTKEHGQAVHLPYKAGWKIIVSRRHWRMVLGMIGFGENLINMIFWPLWMFLVVKQAITLGIITSLTTIFATAIGFAIGDLIDRHGARRVLRMIVPFMIGSYIIRPLVGSVQQVLGADFVARSSLVNSDIAMSSQLYKQGRRVGALPYALAFETTLAITKALFAWLLVYVFMVTTPTVGFTIAFLIAAVLS